MIRNWTRDLQNARILFDQHIQCSYGRYGAYKVVFDFLKRKFKRFQEKEIKK